RRNALHLLTVCLLGASVLAPVRAARAEGAIGPLMRFPDIHHGTIVFVHGEDIWSVPSAGGAATRLTLHDGEERFPKFSPDGRWIAFTGEYDGNADVYVMSAHGGEITRVTFHPGFDQVVGWHPTKNKILFSSGRKSFSRFTRLFLVSPDGAGLEELVMHEASFGSLSADGSKIAYTREEREFATWKRYRGGDAQDIYVFDFAANRDAKITDFAGTDQLPMWIGDKVFFNSDRGRVLNLFSYDTRTGAVEQITRHAEYDVRRPSAGGAEIVYELGGTLRVLDTATGEDREVPVEILSDAPEARPYRKNVEEFITDIAVSPTGKRALIVARGEAFTVPDEDGPTRNLTADSGARDKDAAWSPDGRKIAYVSDKSGEYEIYVADAQDGGGSRRLTRHENGYLHTLRWSPDSKRIAFADQTLRCYYVDVETGKVVEVDKAEYEDVDVSLDLKPINDYAWSPDSRFIAYSKMDGDLVYKVYIYSLAEAKTRCVSGDQFNDFGPVFTKDGSHLLFISNRRFDPTLCDFEWEMVYKRAAGIYALTLRKDGEPLLPFESDEEEPGESPSGGESDKAGKDEAAKPARVSIDFDGIEARVEALPLPRGNYRKLAVSDDALFYLDKDEGDFNRFEFRETGPMDLHRFSFEEREEKTVIAGVDRYALSADGKKIAYQMDEAVGMIDATETDAEGKELDLSGLEMEIDPLAEWTQIFNEAWRMERDFYYEPGMHGIDWNAVREKYARILARASCRQDVHYLIGEMIGELNTSHTYVFGGERRREADRVNVGMLGVDWRADDNTNRYRFARILRVPDWTQQIIPPLARPGVGVKEGDYLLAVNGRAVTADRDVYSYFQDLAGEQVVLLVNDRPTEKGAREYTVEPLPGESTLRYLDWVEHNRRLCEEASNGEIGYIHLPDTYMGSAREFPKHFYSQLRKKGIVVDGRFNAGGLDPDIFLQRLDKEILGYWTRRYSHDQTNPAVATRAHLVCLTNRQAGSGGDMLPMEFRMKGMGPVIGTRTWGGLVGVSMFIGLVDGGGVSAPDYRIYDPSGKWVVENEGVTPDIELDLDPVEMSRGYDAQLMKGIEVLLQKIKEDPRPWPVHEPYKADR
ncbi:MAG: tricorn protease, partial [Candidatus Krumholzibacteriota bacterium]|nr:tricorn protease [Candidatus Krumholzibacteriota bacterium]